MSNTVDILVSLGERLASFGHDARTERCINEAIAANGWFTREDIMMAVDAIRTEFLRRDKLEAWLGAYRQPTTRRRIAIVMAGNIPMVGFFDLMCVVVCGYEAVVKCSSKDSVMMGYIIDLLKDISHDIDILPYDDTIPFDMAIATGGDSAAAYFRARYASVPALIRGSRHSVAVISGEESRQTIDGLQRDVFSYGGLGCRNVSLIFLQRGATLPLRPQQPQNTPRRHNFLQTRALLEMAGTPYTDLGSCVAVEQRGFPETACRINYAYYDELSEVEAWLAEHDGQIQCVATELLQHPRRCHIGRTQYPTLTDYADGVDVMDFLTQR